MIETRQFFIKCNWCGAWKQDDGGWATTKPELAYEERNTTHGICKTCYERQRQEIIHTAYGLQQRTRLSDDATVQRLCGVEHTRSCRDHGGPVDPQDVCDKPGTAGAKRNDRRHPRFPAAIRRALTWAYPNLHPQEEIYLTGYVVGCLLTVAVIVAGELMMFLYETAMAL